MASEISWCNETWEVTAGCSKISPGCENCYAARMCATRLKHHPDCKGLAFAQGEPGHTEYDWTGEIRLLPHNLEKPLHWKKPRTIFVNSRSDLFHEDVPYEYIDKTFGVMALRRRQTFVLVTKRAERMYQYMTGDDVHKRVEYQGKEIVRQSSLDWLSKVCLQASDGKGWPLPNVILMVTAENQEQADARIPLLLQTPAAVRGVSVEPMLGPVDVSRWLGYRCPECGEYAGWDLPVDGAGRWRHTAPGWAHHHGYPVGHIDAVHGLDWVICGGESGPGARPMHPDWPRSLRDQCQAAGVPFWFKQWGEWAPYTALPGGDLGGLVRSGRVQTVYPTGESMMEVYERTGKQTIPRTCYMERVGKKAAGNLLDGKVWEQFPGREDPHA